MAVSASEIMVQAWDSGRNRFAAVQPPLVFVRPVPHACPMLDAVPPEPSSAPDPLDAYSAAVVGAVDEVGPAVVSVYVGGAAEAERARGGAGSGVVVTPDGYLLTNEHVVQRVAQARVTFVDGRTAPAGVARRGAGPPTAGGAAAAEG